VSPSEKQQTRLLQRVSRGCGARIRTQLPGPEEALRSSRSSFALSCARCRDSEPPSLAAPGGDLIELAYGDHPAQLNDAASSASCLDAHRDMLSRRGRLSPPAWKNNAPPSCGNAASGTSRQGVIPFKRPRFTPPTIRARRPPARLRRSREPRRGESRRSINPPGFDFVFVALVASPRMTHSLGPVARNVASRARLYHRQCDRPNAGARNRSRGWHWTDRDRLGPAAA
jgi:hypothetical protein